MDAPFSLSNARGATVQLSSSSGREVPHVDGRRLRSERTRQSIIAAFVLLLRENPYQMPTAVQIAWAHNVVGLEGGAAAFEGTMIDRPVVERAKKILAVAQRAAAAEAEEKTA